MWATWLHVVGPMSIAKAALNVLWIIMGIDALAYMQKYLLGSFHYIKVIVSTLIKSHNRKADEKLREYLIYKRRNVVRGTLAVQVW